MYSQDTHAAFHTYFKSVFIILCIKPFFANPVIYGVLLIHFLKDIANDQTKNPLSPIAGTVYCVYGDNSVDL